MHAEEADWILCIGLDQSVAVTALEGSVGGHRLPL
jgi:hypothetical protein